MDIIWERTVIGGETATGDFVAKVDGVSVGRIYPFLTGPTNGYSWSFHLGHSEFRKREVGGIIMGGGKQDAADRVKAVFREFIEYPAEKGGGLSKAPEQWTRGFNAYAKAKGE